MNVKLRFDYKMEDLRNMKENQELRKILLTPLINNNSRKISERKNEKNVPLQDLVHTVSTKILRMDIII